MKDDRPLPSFSLDPRFLWDRKPTPEETDAPAFRAWYLARVLETGGIDDLRKIGFPVIRAWMPRLRLPNELQKFWDWYFRDRNPDTRAA